MLSEHAPRLAIVALALAGCRAGPNISPYDSSLLGLYTIESWTANAASCAAEGPSVLAERSERLALVEACTVPHEGLHVAPCEDVGSCAREVCDGNVFRAFPLGWDRLVGDDKEGWRGKSWQQPEQVGDHCEAVLRDASETLDGETLVVRVRVFPAVSFPIDETGHCWDLEEAAAAVEGQSCAGLEAPARPQWRALAGVDAGRHDRRGML
ncbi:hypothetical protein SAMN02745121_08409 [Nannocystis exedens]|uniref:Uncharacterized protein n=1 Tax=Nannocystis exedens TaxID=54 RepID=A0A1I2I740_9BACT|nr:hypothetical protein [Nannocystis exedens]PCC74922.1 hypothetical protein NAEX_08022 [Nannocystis exedens]SFF36686.1 hypothetical protein SAMN02745121_08409 [Nannocystis exedens]